MQDDARSAAGVQVGFWQLAAKTVISHTLTYFVMGALAFHFLHYAELINAPGSGMRPVSHPLVILGPMLQVFRGVLFALVFYPLRERLFGTRRGWLLMAWILIAVGILGTFAAPAGSFEGYIYTTIPPAMQMRGYLEIVPQAILFSALLGYWVRRPAKRWLNWTLGALYAVAIALPLLSFLAPQR